LNLGKQLQESGESIYERALQVWSPLWVVECATESISAKISTDYILTAKVSTDYIPTTKISTDYILTTKGKY